MPRLSRSMIPLLNALTILVVLAALWIKPGIRAQATSATTFPQQQAEDLLARLTPEERIGQLFLVTFKGTDVGQKSQIYDLITNRHIGGMVLLSANDNITNTVPGVGNTAGAVLALNTQLQQDEWDYSQQVQVNPTTNENHTPAYVPLFIAISQEGDGYPYDQILRDLTPLPNAMAIGANWNPELASQVGAITGKELAILGINLLLGPSLDVLEAPRLEVTSNLGTRSFGGDPFWVGEMGRAYIRGVHQGSASQVAVVAKHFPGHGSSDRLPEDEVATVRKSLEQLQSFDLAPFIAVTGNAPSPEETSDALMVSHIRYQGLQGNIRATTRPVSFDPQAFSLLMSLPPLDSWRQNGGLMMSDDLGSRAVRRFYDLVTQTFDARRVALNAFLAGNDLLYIGDFSSTSDPDSYLAAGHTLDFFAQKYREDTAFAQRVDASVLRILNLKFRLYKSFTVENVLAAPDNLAELGQATQVTFDVARKSATLLSPTQAELDDTMPDPPDQNDRIVFITDVRTAQQCSRCPPFTLIDEKALQDAVTRLYGSPTGRQINPNHLSSYSLADLDSMLNAPQPEMLLENDLSRANWIIFSMLNASNDVPSFQTLSHFLSERPDLFQQKRLIVFAFCAPYYLDATNISKLTAYYGLYGKTSQFVDVAAYLLFRELRPSGASPVSVPGIGYDLNEALFPDPAQIIPLELDLPQPETSQATTTPEPSPTPEYHVGNVIPLRTGVILDHNGHPVPDNTPVTFIMTMGVEANSVRQEQTTKDGIAHTTFTVASFGTLEIHAESENARSVSLKFDIPSPTGEIIPTATATPLPSPTPTLTPTAIPKPVSMPPPPVASSHQPGFSDWLMAVLISLAIGWSIYRLSALAGQVRWGVRAGFLVLIGGLLAYTYMILNGPGSEGFLKASVSRGVFLSTLAGAFLGLLIALSWRMISEAGHRHSILQEKN